MRYLTAKHIEGGCVAAVGSCKVRFVVTVMQDVRRQPEVQTLIPLTGAQEPDIVGCCSAATGDAIVMEFDGQCAPGHLQLALPVLLPGACTQPPASECRNERCEKRPTAEYTGGMKHVYYKLTEAVTSSWHASAPLSVIRTVYISSGGFSVDTTAGASLLSQSDLAAPGG